MIINGAPGGTEKHIEEVASRDDPDLFISFRRKVGDDLTNRSFSFFVGQQVPITFDFWHSVSLLHESDELADGVDIAGGHVFVDLGANKFVEAALGVVFSVFDMPDDGT